MEQRTLNLDGTMVYCYADGSVEFFSKSRSCYGLHRTFGSLINTGYLRVTINGSDYMVHRLIALAFHENPNNLPQVDHLDRNKKNNKPENLRWCTRKENMDNQDRVDKSLDKYGVRKCDDQKAYFKQYKKHCLHMAKPDGSDTMSGTLSPEEYDLLKPLSRRERYLKYQELKKK